MDTSWIIDPSSMDNPCVIHALVMRGCSMFCLSICHGLSTSIHQWFVPGLSIDECGISPLAYDVLVPENYVFLLINWIYLPIQ